MATPDQNNQYFWKTGHINLPWKNNEHRMLNYVREPYNDPRDAQYWRDLGFTHEHFTGEMYDMKNPELPWMGIDQLKQVFPFEHFSWSFYKMTSGVILPRHVDRFVKFKEMYDCKEKTVVRALIMLEDWKHGHYLDMDDKAIVDWKAGDYAIWTSDVPHTAANIGFDDRYTLQITGLLDL